MISSWSQLCLLMSALNSSKCYFHPVAIRFSLTSIISIYQRFICMSKSFLFAPKFMNLIAFIIGLTGLSSVHIPKLLVTFSLIL